MWLVCINFYTFPLTTSVCSKRKLFNVKEKTILKEFFHRMLWEFYFGIKWFNWFPKLSWIINLKNVFSPPSLVLVNTINRTKLCILWHIVSKLKTNEVINTVKGANWNVGESSAKIQMLKCKSLKKVK